MLMPWQTGTLLAWSFNDRKWVLLRIPARVVYREWARACAERWKARRRRFRNRWGPTIKRYTRPCFTLQRFSGGHWVLGALNWYVVRDPRLPYLVARNRPWPWAVRGLPAAKMKTTFIPWKRGMTEVDE